MGHSQPPAGQSRIRNTTLCRFGLSGVCHKCDETMHQDVQLCKKTKQTCSMRLLTSDKHSCITSLLKPVDVKLLSFDFIAVELQNLFGVTRVASCAFYF